MPSPIDEQFMKWHGKEVLDSARNEVERAIARGTILVQNRVGQLLNQASGPTKTNPTAQPSLPGEPPHKRTGTLARSIESETFRIGDQFVGRVGTNLKYGAYLEFGTRKMAPRPYLRPALDELRPQILREIQKARLRGG
jgi:HK97 gp10 family phage protein